MVGLVVASWLVIQVQGAGNCPSPADVEEKLAPLLPEGFFSASGDVVNIAEQTDGTLSVSLARPDGKIVGRRLPRAATCGEQAETVAVALAVWEAQIHPEISLRLDRLTASATPVPTAPPAPAGAGLVIKRAGPSAPERAVSMGVGAALMGDWQPGSIAPGARLDATLGTASGTWRARLSVAGLGTHSESLPPGEARWWRLYFALGADHALVRGQRWDLALGAAGVLGVATAEGAGFTSDRTATTADVGIEALLRADLRLGAVRPWLGLAVVTWLRQQTLDVTGMAASLVLPRVEPMVALGTNFYWQP
jgi:hypothetical protein